MAFNKKYLASSTQTVFDLALQLKGSADKAFEMMSENPDVDNINSDPTGVEIDYNLTNDVIQKYYISKGITIATKPVNYYNSLEDALLINSYSFLVQEDGYKLLLM